MLKKKELADKKAASAKAKTEGESVGDGPGEMADLSQEIKELKEDSDVSEEDAESIQDEASETTIPKDQSEPESDSEADSVLSQFDDSSSDECIDFQLDGSEKDKLTASKAKNYLKIVWERFQRCFPGNLSSILNGQNSIQLDFTTIRTIQKSFSEAEDKVLEHSGWKSKSDDIVCQYLKEIYIKNYRYFKYMAERKENRKDKKKGGQNQKSDKKGGQKKEQKQQKKPKDKKVNQAKNQKGKKQNGRKGKEGTENTERQAEEVIGEGTSLITEEEVGQIPLH